MTRILFVLALTGCMSFCTMEAQAGPLRRVANAVVKVVKAPVKLVRKNCCDTKVEAKGCGAGCTCGPDCKCTPGNCHCPDCPNSIKGSCCSKGGCCKE